MSSNNFSRPAAARIGPEPIAKNFSPLISQPAYCDAMQAATGSSLVTSHRFAAPHARVRERNVDRA